MKKIHKRALFHSFRNRLAVYVGLITLGLGLITATFASSIASKHLRHASNQYLHRVAFSIADAMASLVEEREREVRLLSRHPLLTQPTLSANQVRTILNQMGRTYEHYSWIGFANTHGDVLVANDGLLEGKNVSQRPWFKAGLTQSFVGDVHGAVMLSKLLGEPGGEPLRFIDVAAPVKRADGSLQGVIATHINWAWVSQLLKGALPASSNHIDAFVVSGNGDVLYPYASMGRIELPSELMSGSTSYAFESEGQRFLSVSASVEPAINTQLDWHVIIRQPEAIALASIQQLRWQIFIAAFVFVGIAVLLAFRLASSFSKPIEKLAMKASRVENGDENQQFYLPSSVRELETLSSALQSMKNTLVQRRSRIQSTNQTLEKQVEARTRELEAANQKLERQARQDALTGLNNRRAANEYLQQAFAEMKRSQRLYTVAVADIDHFKNVNDSYGHDVGDDALRYFAQQLQTHTREADFIARSGGEEFLIVMPATDSNGGRILAEKLREAVAASPPAPLQTLTLSIGIAAVRSDDKKDGDVVSRADNALYKAKNAGRNRVEVAAD